MPFNSTPITVLDGAAAPKSLIAYSDGTSSAFAHPILDGSGAIISPATSGKQDTGNAALAQIVTNTTALSTAAQQSTANNALATIATNTAGVATAANQATQSGKLDTIIANTGAGTVNLSAQPTVTAGAYTAGMVVGGKIAFSGAARVNGGTGYIHNAFVAKIGNQTAPFDLFVFHSDPAATFTDRTAMPDITADLAKLAGIIHCEDLVDCGTPKLLQMAQSPLPFDIGAADTTLYVVPVIRGGETYANTSAVIIALGIGQN